MKLSKILQNISNDVLCEIISLLHKSLPDIDGKICGLRSQLFQQNNLDTNLVLLQKVKRCLIVRRHQGLLLHFHLKLHLKYKLHVLHRKICKSDWSCYFFNLDSGCTYLRFVLPLQLVFECRRHIVSRLLTLEKYPIMEKPC